MSQEDKPVAEVLSTQVEAWQREVSALQEKIAFAIGKPVAAHEPETESFVQTVPAHCDRIVWKGTYIHLPIANAAPCARCKEFECDVAHWKANHDNRVEAARLLIDRPDLPLERVKAYQAHIALQAKITEQAAEIARINRIASCGSVDSWMSLSDDDKRKWFAVTLDVDQKKADRIKALEAELSLIKPNSDCDSGCMLSCSMEGKANAATIERQRKVVKLSEQALTEVQDLIAESRGVYGLHLNGDKSPWDEIEQGGWFERLVTLPEALAAIAELEQGVG